MADRAGLRGQLWPPSSPLPEVQNTRIRPPLEAGICRICRGEGTPHEPLYCPCRCSGSIQHVHQDCLMEWLSHSQKKYCELCKTSYRFTKFYDPNMPQFLSLATFIRQTARYLFDSALGWTRAVIAMSFWVSWLPYVMRKGWTYMFWISQENLINSTPGALIELSSSVGSKTCPSSPLFAPKPACSINAKNAPSAPSVTNVLVRSALKLIGLPVPSIISGTSSIPEHLQLPINETGTLLSNVTCLNSLTRYTSFNSTLIQVLEGQIITIVVVVSFIVLILVRDYVVQQQPDIANVRAQFDEDLPENDHEQRPENEEEPAVAILHEERLLEVEPQQALEEAHVDGRELPDTEANPVDPLLDPHANDWNDGETFGTRSTSPGASRGGSSAAAIVEEEPRPESWSSDQGSSSVQFTPENSEYSQSEIVEGAILESDDKGKGNVQLPNLVDVPLPSTTRSISTDAGPSRPRAVSDGPQLQNGVNPLANNTWTFAALPPELTARQELSSATSPQPSQPQEEPTEFPTRDAFEQEPPVPAQNQADPRLVAEPVAEPERVATPPIRVQGHSSQSPEMMAPHIGPTPPLGFFAWMQAKIAGFMWGGLDEPEPAETASDEATAGSDDDDDDWVDDDEEAPADQHLNADGADGVDDNPPAEAVQAGMDAQAGLDAQAMEDMEDFEGIMELLGMRGPVTNLLQNVIFCGVLVQSALFACVLIPFNIGRFSIWLLAKPMRFVRITYEITTLTSDLVQFMIGFTSWIGCNFVDMITAHIGGRIGSSVLAARKGSWAIFRAAWTRLTAVPELPAPGIQYWSAASREALFQIQDHIWTGLSSVSTSISLALHLQNPFPGFKAVIPTLVSASTRFWALARGQESFVATIKYHEPLPPVDLSLASWSGPDMTWAVIAGYLTIVFIAGAYLRTGFRFLRGTAIEDWEQGLIDSLYQLSGIMKVILIISIEMLVFPLYCGMLLDCALLPLFANTTFKDRLLFTYQHAWTSTFVHWFVGTGYMFHFALFVSMCRKIMRPGVLFFIRDPDDPEFHPIRDVLERSLVTQLRKILFSALVYGALVIICLGGVVWGLHWSMPGVLPIHFSSNEPVLEFPVDLLFYNFLIPIVFKLAKPGDRLHAMYQWCFRKSARVLRLTFFLFGERRIDEEGTLQLAPSSPDRKLPAYQRFFLHSDYVTSTVVPKGWWDVFNGVEMKPRQITTRLERKDLRHKKAHLVESGQIIPDGHFALAPATDRIKISKGKKIFLEVNERGRREDGQPLEGLHDTNSFQMVYVPPQFIPRVFLFILLIWTFAAVTGVSLTIIPLILGRIMFRSALPNHVHTNDIYAFCLGAHVLTAVAYALLWMRKPLKRIIVRVKFQRWMRGAVSAVTTKEGLHWVTRLPIAGLRLLYTYTVVLLVLPLTMVALLELYLLLPIHSFTSIPSLTAIRQGTEKEGSSSQHNIRVIEAWTLGLLYTQLVIKAVKVAYPQSRFVKAMNKVFHDGWLSPDVTNFTRAFVVPGMLASGFVILGPAGIVRFLDQIDVLGSQSREEGAARKLFMVKAYRHVYPLTALVVAMLRSFLSTFSSLDDLLARIRDDVYLMGERLQNYDGSRPESRRAPAGDRGLHAGA